MVPTNKNLLALDVGSKRIGVASTSAVAKLPSPLTTIKNDEHSLDKIQKIIDQEEIGILVIGLPRNLSGGETEQTKRVQDFGRQIAQKTGLKIYWQDEALTSIQAETELKNRGVRYNKEHVDALAATYILNDFLSEHREVKAQ
jgi:putative Holliday junction resolvase